VKSWGRFLEPPPAAARWTLRRCRDCGRTFRVGPFESIAAAARRHEQKECAGIRQTSLFPTGGAR